MTNSYTTSRDLTALAIAFALILTMPLSAGSPARADDSPPSRPTGPAVSTQPGSLSASVDWDDVSGATHYVARLREPGPGNILSEGVENQSSNTDITVADYGRWVVRVEACNSAGCGLGTSKGFEAESPAPKFEDISSPAEGSTPVPPLALAAKQLTSEGGVTLTWNAPEDDGGYPITGYRIVRSHYATGSDGLLDRIHEVVTEDTSSTSTTYVDSSVKERTAYDYRIWAINSAGTGSVSASVSIVTARQTDGVPDSPVDLNAVEDTAGEVTLTWSAPEDDGGYPITGYSIIRSHYATGQDGRLERIHEVLTEDTGSATTTYVDSTVEERTTYDYRVRAINSAGASGVSSRVSITTARQGDGTPGSPGVEE